MLSLERVNLQNAMNKCINQIELDFLELLLPWLNKKIMTIKRERTAKFNQKYDAFLTDHGYNQPGSSVWVHGFVRYNSFILSVRNSKMSLSVEIYIGRCNDQGGLIELKESTPLKTDYTLSGVESAFHEARELEQKARELLNSVSDFSR